LTTRGRRAIDYTLPHIALLSSNFSDVFSGDYKIAFQSEQLIQTDKLVGVDCDNSIETVRIDSWEKLAEHATAWAELEERLTSSTIFQTFEWHHCWWKAFGQDHELFVVLCHKNNRLVGIAPMMITSAARLPPRRGKDLRFIGCVNDSSDYLDFLIDPAEPEALDVILKYILDHLSQVDRVHLSHYPSHSDTQQKTIDFFVNRGCKVVVQFHQEAPYRLLGDKTEDKKVANKSSLRRRYNFFQKSGELLFHRCVTEVEGLDHIDEFFDQHVERRNLTHSPSQFHDSAQRSFFRDLIKNMLPRDSLRFDMVLFDGEPIAFHFGFEHRKKFYWYKPTFNVRYANRSPGDVLIKFLLEDAIDKDLDEFDFTVGSEPFKYRFSNRTRANNEIIVFRSNMDFWQYRSSLFLKTMRRRASEYWAARRLGVTKT
jgi:CelD/BcsL family acetyltransferase involved in cellulose biosynthesis